MLVMPSKDEREVHEIRDPRKFDRVVRSRPGQRVQVVVQAAARHPLFPDRAGPFWDVEVFWDGPSDTYKSHIPTDPVLKAIGLREGAAFVQSVVRAVI